ncbi:hypothetical protein MKX64_14985 [Paenibacillus sp. FSL M8-0334]
MSDIKMYCLICRRIVKVAEGGEVFKTGFYRYHTPMGICVACQQKNRLPGGDSEEH